MQVPPKRTAAMAALSLSVCCLSDLASSAGTAAIGRPIGFVIQSSRASAAAAAADESACGGISFPPSAGARGLTPLLPSSREDGESGSLAASAFDPGTGNRVDQCRALLLRLPNFMHCWTKAV